MSAGERLPGTPTPMHTWTGAGGLTIAGDTWGDPNGPLVVLQHGGGQTRHAWRGAGEALGDAGYHAVAFDARGHGDSGWAPADEYGQDYMVKDLICVVEALGGKRPILVGASMGGGVSLIAIGESHVAASALVLVDMAPHTEPEGRRRIQEFMAQKPEGFDSLQEVADAIANYQPHRPRPRTLDGLAKNVRLGADGKYHWHWDPARRRTQGDQTARRERGWQVRSEARSGIQRPPSAYLNKFYYDCLTHSEPALRYLIDTVGADRVVFGTDWPADMAIDWPVSWVLSLKSLTQEEKEAILWKNLEKLLRI